MSSGDDWLMSGTTDPAELSERYDEWAAGYDADLSSWSYEAPHVVAQIVAERADAMDSVLDVGCGTGLVGRALRAAGHRGSVIGLDISPRSLDLARQTQAYDSLAVADLQQPLEVEDAAMDALVCVGVLTYLPDVEAVLREFTRVVRPGGLVVFTQREDLWEAHQCREIIDRMADEGRWTPLDVTGPAPYLPTSDGDLAELGCHYVTARVGR